MTLPLARGTALGLPGAVPAEGRLAGGDAHYGQPVAEQRRLARGGAFVVVGDRSAVRVTGEDRLSWLHSLASQDFQSLSPGESRRALFLTGQGRVDVDVDVVASETAVYLISQREDAARLASFLERMRFMLRVEVENLADSHALLGWRPGGAWPEAADAAIAEAALVLFEDPWAQSAVGGYTYLTAEAAAHLQAADYRWTEALVPQGSLQGLVAALLETGLTPAGLLAREAQRIMALKPAAGAETDERTVPHELDLLRTSVHLAKGCYKGQETVARVHNLGHPPRRLVFLEIDGSAHTLPAPGSEVFVSGAEDGRPIGTLTSVALHEEAGPIGLAVVKRTADAAADLVVVDEGERYAAAQTPVVAPDAGSVVGRPSGIRRLS
ncbi:glycine cleavage T C-terminal barrel domain-containing protein [Falsarthrobacter nasiphocae]|uniref:Folate-binding protein YgfZ n=1 Tax=Falsarthrobacter nasiphocae TaxID=189863 RepID=A0AAE3YI78_9MICC|nr:glycine cleavage T C-terminal barrel domain-containing protein [Falsarthrobacter nasiphocae]MDR6892496.1 folate-binding protein YgfZ [Falsarthrobacter nasiphocae]